MKTEVGTRTASVDATTGTETCLLFGTKSRIGRIWLVVGMCVLAAAGSTLLLVN